MTTIKMSTQQVIAKLTESADKYEADNKKYEAAGKKYEAAEAAWQKAMFKAAIKHSNKATEVRIGTAWRNDSVTNIDFNIPTNLLPARPDRDDFFNVGDTELVWTSPHTISEIRKFVGHLEMSVDDVINMSSLKSMSDHIYHI